MIDVRNQMPGGASKRSISQIKKIVRHHSATNEGDALSFARYHTQTLGWKTSGYHEIILRDGTVQLCYDPSVITNGVGNHNSYTYHICLVGNGNFTAAQEQAFLERAEVAMQLFNLKVSDVLGHKEFKGHESNTCPGVDMNKVRSSLSQYIANKNVKGGEDKLLLTEYQWSALEQNVNQLLKEKVISDQTWLDKVKKKTLTVSELAWLNNMVVMRLRK